MDFIKFKIEKSRKNIKPNSLNAYLISLRKLKEALTDEKEIKNLDFLKNEEKVIEFLHENYKLTTQKNYLAAIIVGLDAFGEKYEDEIIDYKSYLDELNNDYNTQISKNEKTEKQNKNWVSLKTLRKVMNEKKNDLIDRGVFKKDADEITRRQFNQLQEWVVANLYLNDENPPIRLDYGDMRVIKETDYNNLNKKELKENYLVVKSRNNKYFSFGNYKTEKTYNLKKIDVGKKLNSVLNIWLKYNKNGSLLVDTRGNSMSSNQLSKYVKKVFKETGKDINVNLLRHIYISEKFPPEKEKEKEEVAEKMHHSVKTQGTYSKKD